MLHYVMKKIIVILYLVLPVFLFSQSSRDINTVIQKTLDLHALKEYYSDSERSGETPLLIINEDKIPDNLIVFKFNKRVKVMTHDEIKIMKSIYKGNLDSYFVFDVMDFGDNHQTVSIKASFRKENTLTIHVSMKKEKDRWIVIASKVT